LTAAGSQRGRQHHPDQHRRLSGVLKYSTDPLVSRDIVGDPASCVFDSGLTQAAGNLVKIFGWYDNEWGYTSRLVDLAAIVGSQL
jgi:glyceraldehyde 3-phosphate dehydrogenase